MWVESFLKCLDKNKFQDIFHREASTWRGDSRNSGPSCLSRWCTEKDMGDDRQQRGIYTGTVCYVMISDRKYQNHIAGRNHGFCWEQNNKNKKEAWTVFDRLTNYCPLFYFPKIGFYFFFLPMLRSFSQEERWNWILIMWFKKSTKKYNSSFDDELNIPLIVF